MYIKISLPLGVKSNEFILKVTLNSFKTIVDARHSRGLK
tara:strand:+ start:463 stop:579 length:117 start_codon:yes stop_codon:yes gene_type:complete